MDIKRPFLLGLSCTLLPQGIVNAAENAQDSTALDKVIVTESKLKEEAFWEPKSSTVITGEELEVLQPTTINQVIDSAPGVTITDGNRPLTGQINIRGFTNERINLSIDGIETKQYSDGTSSASSISAITVDPDTIKYVRVFKGGEGISFGSGAIGGAVELRTKEASDYLNTQYGSGVRVSGSGVSGSNGGRIGVTGFMAKEGFDGTAHISVAKFGDVDTPDDGLGEIKNDTKNVELRLKGNFTLRDDMLLSSVTSISDTTVGEMPYLNNSRYADFPMEEQQKQSFQQGFKFQQQISDVLIVESNLSLDYQKNDRDQNGSLVFGPNVYDFDTLNETTNKTINLDLIGKYEHQLGAIPATLTAKLDYTHSRYDQDFIDRSNGEISTTYGKSKGNAYALALTEKANLTDKILLDAGVRYDKYSNSSSTYPEFGKNSDDATSYNLGLSFTPKPWLLAYGRFSEGFRAPNLRELYKSDVWSCHRPRKVCFESPQPDLKPETSQNLELGLGVNFSNLKFADDLAVKANIYQNTIKNYLDTAPYMYYIDENGERVHASPQDATHRDYSTKNIGKLVSEGIELEAYYAYGSFDATLTYSRNLMDVYDNPNFYLGTIDHERTPYVDAPQDNINLRLGYQVNPDINLAAVIDHKRAMYRLPELYLENGYGADSSTVLAIYGKFTPFKQKNIELSLGVENLTNKAYRNYPDSDGKLQPGRSVLLTVASTF